LINWLLRNPAHRFNPVPSAAIGRLMILDSCGRFRHLSSPVHLASDPGLIATGQAIAWRIHFFIIFFALSMTSPDSKPVMTVQIPESQSLKTVKLAFVVFCFCFRPLESNK